MNWNQFGIALEKHAEAYRRDCQQIVAQLNLQDDDVRRTAFTRSRAFINSALFACMFINRDLGQDQFWNEVTPGIVEEDRDAHVDNFTKFVKLGLIQGLFSMLETTFRILLRDFDSNACARGTAGFEKICNCLLDKHLESYPAETRNLLKLLSLVRNTVHNNGIYYPRSNKNDSVTFKGTQYDFDVGQPITFIDGEFLSNRIGDIRELLVAVVNNPNVSSRRHIT